MAANNYLRPQSYTELAQKQNYLIAQMNSVLAIATELKMIEDQIALGGFPDLAEKLGYTSPEAVDDAQAAYNLLGSLISVNLSGFYAQMIGRMGA